MKHSLRQAELAVSAKSRGQRREISIAGVTTVFWFYPAPTPKRNRQALVMVHGYRGNHHGLEAIVGAFNELDVYIPDLPGFGQSGELLGEHSIEHYGQWLNAFIESLALKAKPHLLGHSFGSIVVSAYAAKFSGIKTLILENPVAAPALKGPKAITTLVAKAFFWLAGLLPERLGTALLKSKAMVRGMSVIMTKSRIRELRRWIHAQHDANFNDFANRRVALEAYVASISNCVSDFASDIKVPVLMLIGDRDDITSVKQQQELFNALESHSAQMLSFAGVGHLTHYEIPEAIATAVEEWICDAET